MLHGIDLQIEDGEIVSILGANGAGKTTTLRAISGRPCAAGELRSRQALSGKHPRSGAVGHRARAGGARHDG